MIAMSSINKVTHNFILSDLCHERQTNKPLLEVTEFEFNGALRRFYAEARNKSGAIRVQQVLTAWFS